MKLPQFELGRLLISMALFGAATACFTGHINFGPSEIFARAAGIYLIVGAIGVPFKRGFYLINLMPLTAMGLFAVVCVFGGIVMLILAAFAGALGFH